MRINGRIKCECGRNFEFETIRENISCAKCRRTYKAIEHGEEVVEEPIEEEVVYNDGEVQ
jgi:hypothetical protein